MLLTVDNFQVSGPIVASIPRKVYDSIKAHKNDINYQVNFWRVFSFLPLNSLPCFLLGTDQPYDNGMFRATILFCNVNNGQVAPDDDDLPNFMIRSWTAESKVNIINLNL